MSELYVQYSLALLPAAVYLVNPFNSPCLSRKVSILKNLFKVDLLLLLPLQLFYPCTSVISPTRLTGNEPLSVLPLNSLPEENVGRAHYKLCDRLKLEKKQRRMCRRDPGVAETLREAVTMSALECQYQFRFERWNCTLEGRHRANILKRGMASSSIYSKENNPDTRIVIRVATQPSSFPLKWLWLVDHWCVGVHKDSYTSLVGLLSWGCSVMKFWPVVVGQWI